MRITTTIFFILCTMAAAAQPANDECTGAINLPLSTPPPCPSTGSVTNTFNYSNTGATPTTPYPTFSNCTIGSQTSAPADEVWFSFVPNSNQLQINISGGLTSVNVVIFTGTNCAFLTAVECARSGSSTLTLPLAVTPNQQYYMLVSGGGLGDQGNFTITMVSSRDCNPCLQSANFVAFPPPLNGTYNSGQTVNFCYTITQWNVTGTIEWLHAIELNFGPGWDVGTLIPTPPPSCGGDGSWGWYNSWTSCATGQTFGPGFAYDSSSGLGCGGTPNDGNPGNNWGDGVGNCAAIGTSSPPVTFCWSIQVAGCPPNNTGNSLSVIVNVLSDGDSGSWTQVGCNSGVEYNFLASAVCCGDGNPNVSATPTRCPQVSDGTITMEGSTPGKPYNFFVFNSSGQLVFQQLGVVGPFTASNFPPGQYSVLAVNVESGCQRSQSVVVDAGMPPQAIASNGGPYCPGAPIALQGSFSSGSPPGNVSYQWTGPGGFSSTQQNPTNATMAGTYTLVVNIDGCTSPPATTTVVLQPALVNITASPNTVCPGTSSTLSATGSVSYSWSTGQSGNSISVSPGQTTTYNVTATNAFGCSTVESITVNTHPVPNLSISAPPTGCDGEVVVLFAIGGPFSQYQWSDGQTGNPAAVDLSAPSGDFSVTATTTTGCQVTASTSFPVFPNPVAVAAASPASICAGQTATLNATGGAFYSWSNNANNATITVAPAATTTYQVTVTAVDGCTDTTSVTVNVAQPLAAPVVTCSSATSNTVNFSWPPVPGATGYSVNVLSGQTGTLSGTTYSVTGLAPGAQVTIQVAAQSGTVCPNTTSTLSCSALSCPPVGVAIQSPGDFCFGANTPVTLSANITGGAGNGTRSWAGPGIIDTGAGVFHPDSAGTGNHAVILNYTEGQCTYSDTVDIRVFAVPNAAFTVGPAIVCQGSDVVITYTGTAGPGATYTWNFDGGTAAPATGQGPHTVSWATAGNKTISLTVTENGCTSTQSSQTVQVDAPLSAPVVSCGTSTTTSVVFIWAPVPGATGYAVNVLSGPGGTLSGTSYTVSGLTPSQQVQIEVVAQGNTACGPSSTTFTCAAAACPSLTVAIAPVTNICLTPGTPVLTLQATVGGGSGGTGIWSGTGITDTVAGTFDPTLAGPGQHIVNYTYTEGPCSAAGTQTINVFATPTASFSATPATVCTNQPVDVSFTGNAGAGATYLWNFDGGTADPATGEGPHTVSWATAGNKTISLAVTENGCTSIQASQTVQVDAPLSAPVINCATSTEEIVFSWADVPGAAGYEVIVLSGPAGIQSGNTYTVSGLMPDDAVQIRVTALNTGPCGPSTAEQSCVAQACPGVNITINPVSPICLAPNSPVTTLTAVVTGGAGGGILTWSGPGVAAGTSTFDPNVAGTGTHAINLSYQEGACTWNSSISIVVNAVPTSSFTAGGPVCIATPAAVTYTGNATVSATYNWNFDGGTANPGTGRGPHNVVWATPGVKVISLTVTENGCASTATTQSVTVQAPLASPVINCATSTSQIVFSWADVAGASGYEVNVLNGPAGVQSGNTYTVSGLMPGDGVHIRVMTLNAGPCGPSTAELSCVAQACPNVNIALTGVEPICLTPTTSPVTLSATVGGGAGGGTGTWSGPGITNSIAGTFNPATAGPGAHTILFNYQEGTCSYRDSMTVVVTAQPVAAFTAPAAICIDQTASIAYSGSAPVGAVFTWNFGGGTANPGTGPGPHSVSWATGGAKTVSLTVTDNNCASAPFTGTIQVDTLMPAPQIVCSSTSTSITFTWTAVPGATGYQAISISGPQGILSGTTYTVANLSPNQSVGVEITAIGAGACGNSTATATCIAQNCPTLSLALNGTLSICAGEPAQVAFNFAGPGQGPFTVTYSINGGAPITGVFSNGQSIPVQAQSTTTITAISITDNSLPDCSYPSSASWTIFVTQPASAGTPAAPARLCTGATTVVRLSDLLIGASSGGTWTESSASPSTGGSFNPGAGTFSPAGQQPGLYTFTYNISGPAPCPGSQATVSVMLDAGPNADAGPDQTLTCNTGRVSLGGANTSTGPGITYLWTSTTPGIVIADPASRMIEATQAGTYGLTATNDIGCSATDEVVVDADFEAPAAEVAITPISCFRSNDGGAGITRISGGRPPYELSLNGGAFGTQMIFTGLGPRQHTLRVRDSNGCFSDYDFTLSEPDELTVRIAANIPGPNNLIQLGDSVQLEAVVLGGAPVESITWRPDSIHQDATLVWVRPREATTYQVSVRDRNGCRAEDLITIFVERTRRVFIPNAFSPNGDGRNDLFTVYADPRQASRIKKFMIFNRWGETMYELENFQPNDPATGWNGRHRDKDMNSGVYVYFVEVEFHDGEVILYKGDIVLMR